jgi:hypothetical protein
MPFRNIIKPPALDGSLYACPCCGQQTLPERGAYDICGVCGWEDDGQDDHDADEVRGGPNGTMSLSRARQVFREDEAKRKGRE